MKYIFSIVILLINISANAQTDELNQFWNEYAFTKDLSQKWVLEMDVGLTSSSTPTHNNMFHNVTQVYLRGWAHYYFNFKT